MQETGVRALVQDLELVNCNKRSYCNENPEHCTGEAARGNGEHCTGEAARRNQEHCTGEAARGNKEPCSGEAARGNHQRSQTLLKPLELFPGARQKQRDSVTSVTGWPPKRIFEQSKEQNQAVNSSAEPKPKHCNSNLTWEMGTTETEPTGARLHIHSHLDDGKSCSRDYKWTHVPARSRAKAYISAWGFCGHERILEEMITPEWLGKSTPQFAWGGKILNVWAHIP